ncbi:hypothetical protein BCV69DRAFT_198311 [Microstroma glucosiphilum]|uniref:Uncharacterized protein n=1 Tax=Pseudomicrostroma glucosiphilum TaxID=1684307 RepID=A0A316U692_9BASI|nr:hypothetical protein BCV69DRAFT_198311 [Pseudomicrostroma glucosiphilum]PWN20749.1 hypothetical protein BCV69DRAFT_198311 [Pseudomicrostroma glucosiphilum]
MKTARSTAGLLVVFVMAASLLVTQVHAFAERPIRRALHEERLSLLGKRAPVGGASSPKHPLDNFFDWQKTPDRSPPPEFDESFTPSPSASPTPPRTPPMRPATPETPWLIEFSETGDQKSRRPSPIRKPMSPPARKSTSPPKRPPPPVPTTRAPALDASSSTRSGRGVRLVESGPLPMSAQQQKKKGVFTKLKNVLTGKSKPKLSKVFGKSKSKSRISRTGSGSIGTDSAPSRWSMPLERTSRP